MGSSYTVAVRRHGHETKVFSGSRLKVVRRLRQSELFSKVRTPTAYALAEDEFIRANYGLMPAVLIAAELSSPTRKLTKNSVISRAQKLGLGRKKER